MARRDGAYRTASGDDRCAKMFRPSIPRPRQDSAQDGRSICILRFGIAETAPRTRLHRRPRTGPASWIRLPLLQKGDPARRTPTVLIIIRTEFAAEASLLIKNH